MMYSPKTVALDSTSFLIRSTPRKTVSLYESESAFMRIRFGGVVDTVRDVKNDSSSEIFDKKSH